MSRKPVTRKYSLRAIVIALEGREQKYPVYQFSDTTKYERQGHNPFEVPIVALTTETPEILTTEVPEVRILE